MLRKFPILVASLFVALCVSGCGPAFVLDCAYRSMTYDDVVYIKSNKILYKRKSRDGVFGHPNLMKQEMGIFDISSHNEKIIIFPNYRTAVVTLNDQGMDYTIDPISRPDVPYRTCLDRLGSYAPGEEPESLRGKVNKAERIIAKRDADEKALKEDGAGDPVVDTAEKLVKPADIKIDEDKVLSKNESNPFDILKTNDESAGQKNSEDKKSVDVAENESNPFDVLETKVPDDSDLIIEQVDGFLKPLEVMSLQKDFEKVQELALDDTPAEVEVPKPTFAEPTEAEPKAEVEKSEPKNDIKPAQKSLADKLIEKDVEKAEPAKPNPNFSTDEYTRVLKQLPAASASEGDDVKLKVQRAKTPLDKVKWLLPSE